MKQLNSQQIEEIKKSLEKLARSKPYILKLHDEFRKQVQKACEELSKAVQLTETLIRSVRKKMPVSVPVHEDYSEALTEKIAELNKILEKAHAVSLELPQKTQEIDQFLVDLVYGHLIRWILWLEIDKNESDIKKILESSTWKDIIDLSHRLLRRSKTKNRIFKIRKHRKILH
jgi:cellobiose-specific phosphotransferase system component IIA